MFTSCSMGIFFPLCLKWKLLVHFFFVVVRFLDFFVFFVYWLGLVWVFFSNVLVRHQTVFISLM